MLTDQKFCSRCGSPVLYADDNFCAQCGARLAAPIMPMPAMPVPGKKEPSKNFFINLLKCFAYIALLFGIQLIVSLSAQIMVLMNIGGTSIEGDPQTFIINEINKWSWLCGLIEAVLLLLILGIFFVVRRKNLLHEIKLKRLHPASFGGLAVCGAGAQFAAVLILTILYALMPFLSNYSVSDDLSSLMSSPYPVLDFIFIAVLTPIMEEIVFRGLVYTRLRRSLNKGGAIVLCGIIFGLAHFNIEQFLYAAPLGMLMAAAFEKYGSLWAPFAIHFAFNGGNYLAGYLPEKPEAISPAAIFIGCGLMLLSIAFIFCRHPNEEKDQILQYH